MKKMNFNTITKSASMHALQFVIITLFAASVSASSIEAVIQAEQWELSRSGDHLLATEDIASVVKGWSADDKQKIELQYPGGEEGELWVYQVMDWLVALGVPSSNLVVVPGSGKDDVIRLRVIKSGDSYR